MHGMTMTARRVSNAYAQNEARRQIMAENIAHHMTFIYSLVLYDKMGMSWKKMDNLFTKVYGLKLKWSDDDDNEITNESLLRYCAKKKIDVVGFIRGLPVSEKLFLADLKKGNAAKVGGFSSVDSGLLATLLLIIPILKEHSRWSNAKIEEFLSWVAYGIKQYSAKLPKEKGYVWSDEYIRQCFIEDEGFDMMKSEYINKK